MVRSKKSIAREKSPAVVIEKLKKTPKPRSRSRQSTSRKPSSARSKSRSRKGVDSKVRARTRSRSRTRSKSKSPKRKGRPRSRLRSLSVKSPVTRSRARSKSKNSNIESPAFELNNTQQKNPEIEYKEVAPQIFPSVRESKLNEIIRRSISRELSLEKASVYRLNVHNSILPNLKEAETKKVDGFIKEAKKPQLKSTPSFSFSIPNWFKCLFGLIVPPIVVLLLYLACNRNQCTLSTFRIPINWKYYLNPEAGAIVIGFVLFQGLLSLLPIGKRVDGPLGVNGALHYRCNGLLCTVLSVAAVAALWRYEIPVTTVSNKLVSLIVFSVLLAYLFGFILFIKGGRAPIPGLNPASIVGSHLHQFYVGREVNPFFFKKVNIKILLVRTCYNGMLIINGLLALKAYEAKKSISYALGTSVGLNALLVTDFFWFESSFPTTFVAMYEGTGCAFTLTYFLYPFLPTLITEYIIQQEVELSLWTYLAIGFAFIIGFFIYRTSNLQKATFRNFPLNPALSHLSSISTNRGKKLLVSGLWGRVRHPNYLGFIILHWAWASTSGFNNFIPYFIPIITTLWMMLRERQVDNFCANRYQSSWEQYRMWVRYRIFPYVY